MPYVSIIILHWKHVHDTVNCLKTLKKSAYPDFEICVVLNGCTREDKITLRNLFDSEKKIYFIEYAENKGFAEGNNIAIRRILEEKKADYFFLLNNDTVVQADTLACAVAKAQEGFDMVQILMKQFEERNKIDKAGIKLTTSGLTFDITSYGDPAPLFCPSAGAALYSAALLKACALERQVAHGFTSTIVKDYFDKHYFAYTEDVDLGFRARLAGFSAALADKAIVYHKGSASTRPMSDFAVYHTYRNLIWTYLKCYPTTWLIKFLPHLIVGQLAIFAKNLSRKQGKVILFAWRDAWRLRKKMWRKRKTIQTRHATKPRELRQFMSKKLFS